MTATLDRATVTFTGEIHPAADVWPMLPEPDLQRLADDIKTNGLMYPIVLDSEGRVLDGRNRLAACDLAGVQPTFEVYDGDPVARVLSANNERRHMSMGARAMATALTLDQAGLRIRGDDGSGRWKRGSVPANAGSGISDWRHRMTEAGVVLDLAGDLADGVRSGTVSLDAAYKTALKRKEAADSDEAQLATLRAEAPDLASQVVEGTLTLTEAVAANDARKKRAAEDQRDSLALLNRVIALACPETNDGDGAKWATSWVNKLGDAATPDLRDRTRATGKFLLLLADRMSR